MSSAWSQGRVARPEPHCRVFPAGPGRPSPARRASSPLPASLRRPHAPQHHRPSVSSNCGSDFPPSTISTLAGGQARLSVSSGLFSWRGRPPVRPLQLPRLMLVQTPRYCVTSALYLRPSRGPTQSTVCPASHSTLQCTLQTT